MSDWIEENYKEGLNFRLAKKADLFSGQSDFQKVEVFESTHHGRVLLNDGCFMLSERDERIYHEMIVHPAFSVLPDLQNVLIIGGGDGGTAREVLRHPSVHRVVMVEIDSMVVEASKKWIPQTAGKLMDSRLELKIEDGVKYLNESREKFDLIIIDSTDPNGAAEPLFGKDFYADVARCLNSKGIVLAQGESVFYETETQKRLLEVASGFFETRSYYNFTNMTYPGGLWSFLWASNGCHPLKDQRAILDLEMYYYNSEIHKAAFALPEFQKQALSRWIQI